MIKPLVLATVCLAFGSPQARADNPPFILQWGSPGTNDGQFTTARNSLAHDASGNIYVLETPKQEPRVQKFDNNGTFLTKWGSAGSNPGQFTSLIGAIAVAPDGSVYTADSRIQKFTSSGAYVTEFGSLGSGDGQFTSTFGMDTDASGNIYLADFGNDRVDIFSPTGAFLGKWGVSGTGPGQLRYPEGICVEPTGNVVVAQGGAAIRVQRFTSTGTYLATLTTSGSSEGQLAGAPVQIAADADDRVYVTDFYGNRILVFAPDGSFGTQWGSLGSGQGQFYYPTGVTVDALGNIFVFDSQNGRVQKFGYVTPTHSTSWGQLKAIYK